jgi:hypothetical protein
MAWAGILWPNTVTVAPWTIQIKGDLLKILLNYTTYFSLTEFKEMNMHA